ncbi:MAG: hypothetical protein ACF8LK_00020, partial [Phycisphaerales bacterium JB041]
VRRRRSQDAPQERSRGKGSAGSRRPVSEGGSGTKRRGTKQRAPKQRAPKQRAPRGSDRSGKGASGAARGSSTAKRSGGPSTERAPAAAAANTGGGLASYLVRPDTNGPKVRLGVLWFLAAIAALVLGRWAVLVLWGGLAVLAAFQTTRAWSEVPRARDLPGWAPTGAAIAAGVCVGAAGLGTSLGGAALIVVPLVLVAAVMLSGRKPAAAGAAVIGAVLAALPAMSVVLVARSEFWAALFLVAAVSFYDAGFFIGAAESSSRLEGPVTGAIGLLAVTFAASAFEAQPFDRATAWVAGAVLLLACPLGQMLTSAELPSPGADVPAMRRLDSYLVAGPLMIAAVWVLG